MFHLMLLSYVRGLNITVLYFYSSLSCFVISSCVFIFKCLDVADDRYQFHGVLKEVFRKIRPSVLVTPSKCRSLPKLLQDAGGRSLPLCDFLFMQFALPIRCETIQIPSYASNLRLNLSGCVQGIISK